MLSRMLGLLTAAALTTTLTATTLVAAAPAQAAVTGSTSSKDVVLKNRCRVHPIHYSVVVSPGTLLWRVEITVTNPSGHTSEGVVLSSAHSSPTEGTVGFLICGSSEPGTYTVHGLGGFQVVPAVNIPFQLTDSTFEVSRTPTRTALAQKHLGGNRYRLLATVRDQRRGGFKPTDSAQTHFERRVHGTWKVIRGSRTQSDAGQATTVVTAAAGAKVRAVTEHAGYLGGSASRPLRLHRL